MKRPLFVFAGQSNMMGAPVFPAKEQIYYSNSSEYLHKRRRLGDKCGEFKNYGFPVGEFSYIDIKAAYGENYTPDSISLTSNYGDSTLFAPSLCNIKDESTKEMYEFAHFNEGNMRMAPALPPFVVKGLEEKGYCCAYTHIAKGGVPISYYLDGKPYHYFAEKTRCFFEEAEQKYKDDDTSDKIFVWLQGESDRDKTIEYYKDALYKLWDKCKSLGFTKFFMIRVDYWCADDSFKVMKAQEEFCNECNDAYMITRAASFIPWSDKANSEMFIKELPEEFLLTRDAFYGYGNGHINEKGFKTIAKYAVPNIIRVLFEDKAPILEEELVKELVIF